MHNKVLIKWLGTGLTLGALMLSAVTPLRAQPSVIPGQAVGHVVLGMQRADLWKILGRPGHISTVPHGKSLYGEDTWTSGEYVLVVVSEHDKVIQAEFDSPHMTTTGGLTTKNTLAQVRRLHPSLTVRVYLLRYPRSAYGAVRTGDLYLDDEREGFYLDDDRRGIAFLIVPQGGVVPGTLNDPPDTIIIHRTGFRAVPIYGGRWAPVPPEEDRRSLSLLRGWFTPAGLAVHLPVQRLLAVAVDPDSRVTAEPADGQGYLPEIRAWFAGGPHRKIDQGY